MAGKVSTIKAAGPLTKEGARKIRDLQTSVAQIEAELQWLQQQAQGLANKRNAALTEIKHIFDSAVDSAISGS